MPVGTEVGLGPDVIVLDGDTVPLSPKRGRIPSPQFSARVYCGQTAGWIKMQLGMEVGLGPGHIVLDGDPALLQKNGGLCPVQFCGPFSLWPNGWMHQDATWYGGRPQPRRLCVSWGPNPTPKKGWSPQFYGHVYCGQTAAWIKMLLGTEVGLGLLDIVLDGDSAPPPLKVRK